MRPALVALTLVALACQRPQVPAPPPASPPVATASAPDPAPPLPTLEQRRDSAPLIARLTATPQDPRLYLALARIGDAPARTALLAQLRSRDPVARQHAALALGITALLDPDHPGHPDLEPALLTAWSRATAPDERIAIVEALGRLGTPAALPALHAALAPDQPLPLQRTAAIALGVYGRRKQPFAEPTRTALRRLTDPSLTYPVVYALANEPTPPPDPAILELLRSHARATDPELQRLALAGLARRSAAPPLQSCLVRELLTAARDPKILTALLSPDRDQAITTTLTWARSKILISDLAATRQLQAALTCLAGETTAPKKSHRVALEQLRRALRPLLVTGLTDARTSPGERLRQHTLAAIDCQLAQRLAHDPRWRPPLVCGADHLAATAITIAELAPLAHGFGGPDREPRLTAALTHTDASVRIAAVTALGPLWTDPTTAAFAHAAVLHALDDRIPGVLGSAADLITTHQTTDPKPPPMLGTDPLWQRLVTLTPQFIDRDPELHSTLLATLAATRVPASIAACEASRAHPSPAVRKAARACITELGGKDPGPTPPTTALPAPPIDPTTLPAPAIAWTLTTHVGELTIDLDPTAAPWAVAAITELTRRGYYDNLIFHRDVPGFVLQGGDPEGTGWGGPGFVLPSEPTNNLYDRGAVGIADAGKDTGGSQFFFMYARAPHLEGRYTWIGRLRREHLDRLDMLTLGDRILSARIEPGAAR